MCDYVVTSNVYKNGRISDLHISFRNMLSNQFQFVIDDTPRWR